MDKAGLFTVSKFLMRRFCVSPDDHALVPVTLWTVHALAQLDFLRAKLQPGSPPRPHVA